MSCQLHSAISRPKAPGGCAGTSSHQVRAIVDAAFPLLLTAIRSDHDKEAAAAAVAGCAALLKAGGLANCPPELWGETGLMQAIGLVRAHQCSCLLVSRGLRCVAGCAALLWCWRCMCCLVYLVSQALEIHAGGVQTCSSLDPCKVS